MRSVPVDRQRQREPDQVRRHSSPAPPGRLAWPLAALLMLTLSAVLWAGIIRLALALR
jgi:hypothetical protein